MAPEPWDHSAAAQRCAAEQGSETGVADEPDTGRHLILQAMVSIAAADDALDDSETETICRIYQKVTDQIIGADDVQAVAAARAESETRLTADLRAACADLDMATKENLIRASYLVLLADERISARERKKLHDFAAALQIPEIHVTAILEDLSPLSDG